MCSQDSDDGRRQVLVIAAGVSHAEPEEKLDYSVECSEAMLTSPQDLVLPGTYILIL